MSKRKRRTPPHPSGLPTVRAVIPKDARPVFGVHHARCPMEPGNLARIRPIERKFYVCTCWFDSLGDRVDALHARIHALTTTTETEEP